MSRCVRILGLCAGLIVGGWMPVGAEEPGSSRINEKQKVQDEWSLAGSFREVSAVEGRRLLRLIVQKEVVPNPAGCATARACIPRPGWPLPGGGCRTDSFADLPLDAATPGERLRVKLMTDAVLAAFVADLQVEILVDGAACSPDGRPIARGIRSVNLYAGPVTGGPDPGPDPAPGDGE